ATRREVKGGMPKMEPTAWQLGRQEHWTLTEPAEATRGHHATRRAKFVTADLLAYQTDNLMLLDAELDQLNVIGEDERSRLEGCEFASANIRFESQVALDVEGPPV